jgi:hypothetical protein
MLTSPVSIMFSEMVTFFVHLDAHWVSQDKTCKKILRSFTHVKALSHGNWKQACINSTCMDPYCGKAGALIIT